MHWIDPDSLPEIHGRFERFLLNPRGDADGLILADDREVHFPPHMGPEIVAGLKPGAEIRIRGLKPRGADIVAALVVEWDGGRAEDHGPQEPPPHKAKKPERAKRTVEGVIRRALHGPKGEQRGVLLHSGEIVRFPPHVGEKLTLTAGASFAARGDSLKTPLGEVIEAEALGPDKDALHPAPKPKKPR